MARILKPLVRGGGWYPSNKWIPLVKNGGYTTQSGGGDQPEPPTPEVWKTVTGSIVSFVTSVAYPMRKLLAQINPVQDLHGYDAPWAGGSGKNIVPPMTGTVTKNGITFTPDSEGCVAVSGTATATTATASGVFEVKAGVSYTLNGCPSGGGTSSYRLDLRDASNPDQLDQELQSYLDSGSGVSFTPSTTHNIRVGFRIANGYTVPSGIVFKPMLRLSSVTDATFAPYSNECPISGWTGLSGYKLNGNLFNGVFGTGETARVEIPSGATAFTATAESTSAKNLLMRFYDSTGTKVGSDVTLISGGTSRNIRSVTIPSGATLFSVYYQSGGSASEFSNVCVGIGDTFSVSWQDEAGTVYGGTVDVVTGVLTADRVIVPWASLNWTLNTSGTYPTFNATRAVYVSDATKVVIFSSCYKGIPAINGATFRGSDYNGCINYTNSGNLMIQDNRYDNVTDFVNYISTQQLLMYLAEPVVYQLTPQQISTLIGNNTVFVDTGSIEVEYLESGLPEAYTQVAGFTFNSDCYFEIAGLNLRGSDTVQFSMVPRAACNVFGCYTTSDADNNYSLYVSTANNAKYLRYDGSTYKSKFASADLGKRYDISITPTGSHGFPEGQDDTWTEATFEASTDMCIGTTATNASSAKFKGDLLGVFTVAGRFSGVPCKRNSDNVLGYYDMVSKQFYEPASGTPTVVS